MIYRDCINMLKDKKNNCFSSPFEVQLEEVKVVLLKDVNNKDAIKVYTSNESRYFHMLNDVEKQNIYTKLRTWKKSLGQ